MDSEKKKVLYLFLLERFDRELEVLYLNFKYTDGHDAASKIRDNSEFYKQRLALKNNQKITHLWLSDFFAMAYQNLRYPIDQYDEYYNHFFEKNKVG